MQTKNNETRPNLLTGKWRGVYYYRGVRWEGPTNAVGYMPNGGVLFESQPGRWVLRAK